MYKTKSNSTRPQRFNTRPASRSTSNSRVDISKYINKPTTQEEKVAYVPAHKFDEFQIHADLVKQISKRGYLSPTEIQDKSIPHMLEGRDVIGLAGTGTGKTGAFLIPIINKLLMNPKRFDCLIVTPTRELASQIEDEFRKLTIGMKLSSATLIGGTSMTKSLQSLMQPNHVIIGTPGRLLDMVQRGKLPLKQFSTLVLDEFDRMLDMGFIKDIERITEGMSAREQTFLFSATMEKSQERYVYNIVKNPVEVRVTSGQRSANAIEQDVIKVPFGEKKFDHLVNLISNDPGQRIILFCDTKRSAGNLSDKLNDAGISSNEIHGNKSQRAREQALSGFKRGQIKVLVATDVVARGIDVTDVSLVINYEIPKTYDDYIHRVGRTGRAGKSGKAITFID